MVSFRFVLFFTFTQQPLNKFYGIPARSRNFSTFAPVGSLLCQIGDVLGAIQPHRTVDLIVAEMLSRRTHILQIKPTAPETEIFPVIVPYFPKTLLLLRDRIQQLRESIVLLLPCLLQRPHNSCRSMPNQTLLRDVRILRQF